MSQINLPQTPAEWRDLFKQISNAYEANAEIPQDELDQVDAVINAFKSDYPELRYRLDNSPAFAKQLRKIAQLFDNMLLPLKTNFNTEVNTYIENMKLCRIGASNCEDGYTAP